MQEGLEFLSPGVDRIIMDKQVARGMEIKAEMLEMEKQQDAISNTCICKAFLTFFSKKEGFLIVLCNIYKW